MRFRILINILMAVSVLFLPWWISVLLAVIMLVFFSAYEVPLWGFVFDSLYAVPLAGFLEVEFLFTILFSILFSITLLVKKRIIFYQTM